MSESGTAFMALEPARNSSSAVLLSVVAASTAGAALAASACPSTEPTTEPSAFGSMIMMTLPSPRMVLPENMPTSRKQARHRLHHDFLGAEHAIHQHAEEPRADLDHHDGENVGGDPLKRRSAAFETKQLGEIEQRQQLVAQAQHRRVVDQLDIVARGVAGADQLDRR